MWRKEEYEVPESEFRTRLSRVAEFARDRGLGGVIVYSAPKIHQWSQTGHVGYLTNWSNLDRITDTMVVVPAQGEPVLLLVGVEFMLDQIEEVCWMDDIRMVSSPDPRAISGSYEASVGDGEITPGTRTFGGEIRQILKANDCLDKSIGISGIEGMPASLYHDLVDSMDGKVAEIPDIVARLRAIKSTHEVALLRQVSVISDRCYENMVEVLRDGIWGYELSAEMDRVAKRHGADFVYHCMHTAPSGDLSKGKLSVKAHDMRLGRGDYINVNAYVVYKGYWIQADRAGTIGPTLGSSAARALEVNLKAQDEVLANIRPGLEIGQLLRIGNEVVNRYGYEIQGGRIGHGQGLDYSEEPFILSGSKETLQPGHVFVLHVCVGLPGTNILLNPIADLCHVTSDGVEVLNQFPRGIFHA